MRSLKWVLALVGTLAVAATLVATTTYREWFAFGPHVAVEAGAGEPALVNGWEYELTRAYARTTYTDGTPLPPELRFVVATIDVRESDPPEPLPPQCEPRLTIDGETWADVNGAGSSILPASPNAWGLGIDLSGCQLTAEEHPGVVEATYTWGFVVPADRLQGAETVSVDIVTKHIAVSGTANAKFARLTIDPELLR
ncbi:MAG: hypothetical protein Q4G64_03220 [bacterium]|nr:hypothetical protein [bacterium]